MRDHIVTIALLLAIALSADASEPLSMAVSPAHSFAPTNLTIRVHMEPDARNRAFEVVADSGAYYRSSRIQLDGTESPATVSFAFRDLPGGNYDVRGALLDSSGRERAVVFKHIVVIDPTDAE
jgi:hypothetical protein